MILQRVKLTKLKTEDGRWDVSSDYNKKMYENNNVFWVQANKIHMASFQNKDTHFRFQILCALHENGLSVIPVECLEFSNEFKHAGT